VNQDRGRRGLCYLGICRAMTLWLGGKERGWYMRLQKDMGRIMLDSSDV